ncbi:MAG: putative C-S lyase [Opitutae bacterium]|nr:putative C-S lyase [Opitutae bacterium]
MSFDFDTVINRRDTDSRKWHKYSGRDILPLWVADTDFASPPAVTAALQRRVAHGVFGYGVTEPAAVAEAVVAHCARHYHWTIQPEWIVWLPGLVCGLNVAAAAYGADGDEVLTCTPAYPPFLGAPGNQRRRTVTAPLARRDGRWEIDFAALAAAVTPRTRQFFFCHPHNPTGRVFTRPELEAVAAFCERHDLVVTSDEIHCDLILDPVAHLPLASLSPAIAARTVTLMAPSKTYNIPGLGCSYAIIPDAALRARFEPSYGSIVPDVNVLGFVAAEAALREGEPWRQALLAYLRGNRDYLAAFVAAELPGVALSRVEATYLAWLDVSALELAQPAGFFEGHGVGLSDGAAFGAAPGTFVRLNFGCPRATLAEACARLKRALAAR